MADATTVYGKGRIYWPKIVGEKALHSNYEGTGRQWSYELEPEDVSFLKEARLLDRLKDKEDDKNPDKGPYLNLRKPEFTRDGEKNEPIRIYNENDEPWDESVLIGNGTEVDFKLRIVDYGKGKKSGIYTTALRVTKLVPYVSNEFAGMDSPAAPSKEKTPAKKAKTKTPAEFLDDLDDDIPF
jgi:hypothetical protein